MSSGVAEGQEPAGPEKTGGGLWNLFTIFFLSFSRALWYNINLNFELGILAQGAEMGEKTFMGRKAACGNLFS